MQFYMIDKDPTTSSQKLPDYALKRVNIREGFQLISDIGHICDISWNGQNKLYSASHAKTRSLMENWEIFELFCRHYMANLREYKERFGADKLYNTYNDKIMSFMAVYGQFKWVIPESRDRFDMDFLYLLENKSDKLTDEDRERMAHGA